MASSGGAPASLRLRSTGLAGATIESAADGSLRVLSDDGSAAGAASSGTAQMTIAADGAVTVAHALHVLGDLKTDGPVRAADDG